MKRLMKMSVLAGSMVFAGQAAALDFVVDASQSSVTLDVQVMALGGTLNFSDDGMSALSGTVAADLGSLNDPFGTATITDLVVTLDDPIALDFTIATASTTAGDVSFTQIAAGSLNNLVDGGGVFDQLNNQVAGSGDITTSIAGAIDLASAGTVVVDYENVVLTRVGDVLTLSAPITGVVPQQSLDFDFLGSPETATVDATVTGTIVATATVPEPGSLALLGLGGLALARRRRA